MDLKNFKESVNIYMGALRSGTLILADLMNYEMLEAIHGRKKIAPSFMFSKRRIEESIGNFSNTQGLIDLGDGKFLIITDSVEEKAQKLSGDIFRALQLYEIAEEDVFLDYKISSIEFPKFGEDSNELLSKLQSLTNNRHSDGYYYNEYNEETSIETVKTDYMFANSFKQAVKDNRVRFAFQPVINREKGEIKYYECLLRVVDDNEQLISAGPMIMAAEKYGFMSVVDEMVLEMAIKEIRESEDVMFSVNMSSFGILDYNFLKKFKVLLSDPFIASRIIIEITETSIQYSFDKTKEFIHMAHNLGIKVALDDFGTGYTSFKQLKILPIDIVKIDGVFVRDIAHNMDNKFFVEMLIKIANELGIETVAEFVESGEIAKSLIDLKVDYMQGNYFFPAMEQRNWNKSIL